jgi:carbonic anhydrase/acetyltransferase-like protein (isoleucine patch superfamily)
MIRPFRGFKPTVLTSCFIEETGIVIGDALLGGNALV